MTMTDLAAERGRTDLAPADRPRATGAAAGTNRSALAPRPGPSRAERIAVACTLAVIGVVHAVNLGGFPGFIDDEGTYVSQAWAARHGALAPYTYWYDHPPVGWLQLAPLSWLTDALVPGPDVLAARVVMVAATLVSAFLVYLLARQAGLRAAFAVGAAALWGLSPLVVFEGRQVLLDNIALPWILGAFVLAGSHRKNLAHHTVAGLVFAVGVLTKETFLLLAPALVAAIWLSGYRATRAFALTGFAIATALTGSFYVLLAVVRDELLPGPGHVSLWDGLVFQTLAREGSGFILDPASEAHEKLSAWLAVDPVLVLAGVVAALACLLDRRLRPVALAAVLLTAVALRPGGYLPSMYVIGALPFFAIAVAGVGDRFWSLVSGRRATRVLGAALLGTAVLAVGPGWVAGNAVALTQDQNSDYDAALAFVTANLPRDSVVVSDNVLWNDLVSAGWSPGFDGAVWFYKVELDPDFAAAHPEGWRGVDYLVGRPADLLAGESGGASVLREAFAHSTVLAAYGPIEVRAVGEGRGDSDPLSAPGTQR